MKHFNNNRLTKKQVRKEICVLAKSVGVNKVIFSKTGKRVSGTYQAKTKNMYLNLSLTKQQMLRTFFHELGHHTAAKQNKWAKYHFCLVTHMHADTIFDIENKVDKIGKSLWCKYVSSSHWGNYKYSYPKSQKNSIIKNFITNR